MGAYKQTERIIQVPGAKPVKINVGDAIAEQALVSLQESINYFAQGAQSSNESVETVILAALELILQLQEANEALSAPQTHAHKAAPESAQTPLKVSSVDLIDRQALEPQVEHIKHTLRALVTNADEQIERCKKLSRSA